MVNGWYLRVMATVICYSYLSLLFSFFNNPEDGTAEGSIHEEKLVSNSNSRTLSSRWHSWPISNVSPLYVSPPVFAFDASISQQGTSLSGQFNTFLHLSLWPASISQRLPLFFVLEIYCYDRILIPPRSSPPVCHFLVLSFLTSPRYFPLLPFERVPRVAKIQSLMRFRRNAVFKWHRGWQRSSYSVIRI